MQEMRSIARQTTLFTVYETRNNSKNANVALYGKSYFMPNVLLAVQDLSEC